MKHIAVLAIIILPSVVYASGLDQRSPNNSACIDGYSYVTGRISGFEFSVPVVTWDGFEVKCDKHGYSVQGVRLDQEEYKSAAIDTLKHEYSRRTRNK